MSVATRKQKYRQRLAEGKAVLHIEVDLYDHVDMLERIGFLKAWDAPHSRAAIEAATVKLLAMLMVDADEGCVERVP